MKKKSGRVLFDRYKGAIAIAEKIYNLLPSLLTTTLYDLSSLSEAKIALFVRYLYCRRYCQSCGANVFIGKFVHLKNLAHVSFGSNVSVHSFCVLDGIGGLSIGSNTSIASGTFVYSFDHMISYQSPIPVKYLPLKLRKISIGSNVWIGCRTIILAGASIPSNCVIGSGSLVRDSFTQERSLYIGSPAHLKKKYD